ncbi:hypothetical protein B0T14DRAFT_512033 [Immersiella caudata]|uniref:Uncharacterized protein n=1 Tax=Immersiella caudata TaxID=314043 RepID=A0AA39X4K0_9PEZI|nr:hypothetical protein B0T14DRAFT_512033 [Immersiella caudata]
MVIRGRDAGQLDQILGDFIDNPHHLTSARERYDRSPGPSQSGTTTRGSSETPLTPEEQKKRERELQEYSQKQRWRFAIPYEQFNAEVILEQCREWQELGKDPDKMAPDYSRDRARKNVKSSWVEQGIWRKEWKTEAADHPPASWKHELPRPPDMTEKEHAASRPFYRFLNELERDRLILEQERGQLAEQSPSPDINTLAYHRVKDRWVQMGLWNDDWGILPGVAWLYEDLPKDSCPPAVEAVEADKTSKRVKKRTPIARDREAERRSTRLAAKKVAAEHAGGLERQVGSPVTKRTLGGRVRK